jgi:hypothetical protein
LKRPHATRLKPDEGGEERDPACVWLGRIRLVGRRIMNAAPMSSGTRRLKRIQEPGISEPLRT